MTLQLGNIQGFAKELMYIIIPLVVGTGYMGGSISAWGKLSDTELNALFPKDITKLPYASNHIPINLKRTLITYGLIEYFWPMKSLGFPYNQVSKGTGVQHQFLNWMIKTCAYLFAGVRGLFHSIAQISGAFINNCIGDLFVFYVLPYILICCIIPPILPVIGFFWVLFGSMNLSDDCGFMFTFSPITAWFYGISNCKDITVSCMITTCIIGMIGFFMPMAFIPWWICISWCVWAYSIVVLLFSPFLYANGARKMFHEIIKHKISLTVLFMVLTLQASFTYLVPQVSSGVLIGFIYLLYELLKRKKS
jgi:hypothetical protein